MSLVKYGGGVIQMSGSLAGNTFARNRYGNYVRARTKPINPKTANQIAIRTALTTLTTRWSQTLSAAQRTAWNLYASSVSMTNKLGETIFLSGFNHYLRSNICLLQHSQSPVDAGPTAFELPSKDPTFAITASEGSGLISVTFDDAQAWANETGAFLITYQGSPQNAQRNFFAGPWRKLDIILGDDTTAPTTPDTQTAVFAITEGQHIWVYARILRKDGRISEPFRHDVLVSA